MLLVIIDSETVDSRPTRKRARVVRRWRHQASSSESDVIQRSSVGRTRACVRPRSLSDPPAPHSGRLDPRAQREAGQDLVPEQTRQRQTTVRGTASLRRPTEMYLILIPYRPVTG